MILAPGCDPGMIGKPCSKQSGFGNNFEPSRKTQTYGPAIIPCGIDPTEPDHLVPTHVGL